jgi:hypothetical protein
MIIRLCVSTFNSSSIFRRCVVRARSASPRFRFNMLITHSTCARWPYGLPAWLPLNWRCICRRKSPLAAFVVGRPTPVLISDRTFMSSRARRWFASES